MPGSGELRAYLSEAHADALESRRGISHETSARLGIVSQGRALGFEYRTASGTLLFVKWRGPDKSFWIDPAGAKLSLWGLDRLSEIAGTQDSLIITEGELDAASVIEAGYEFTTSVPNGAPSKPGDGVVDPKSDRQFAYLWDDHGLIEPLAKATRIILAVDNDEPGTVLRDELALRLGADRCYGVIYPQGCKDANDVLVKHGAAALRAVIDGAFPLIPDRLCRLREVADPGTPRQYTTGWRALDVDLKFRVVPPELVIVTGKPGAGKSQWALNLCLNLSRLHGLKGAIIQFEDSIRRTRKDLEKYAQHWSHGDVDAAEAWLDEYVWLLPPSVAEDDRRDLPWLHTVIWEAAARHGCKWVIVDPWNEIEHMWDRGQGEVEYTNNALRDLKRLARRYDIAIVLVAHPDKHAGRNESVKDMTLYSISGGSAWKNKADHGIIIAREVDDEQSKAETGRTIVKVDKCKDHTMMGYPGTAILDFDSEARVFNSA